MPGATVALERGWRLGRGWGDDIIGTMSGTMSEQEETSKQTRTVIFDARRALFLHRFLPVNFDSCEKRTLFLDEPEHAKLRHGFQLGQG